ncbi:MAG: DegT/DnrJ/EryC1/StrS family aminotransferase, partial [Clostridiales bacterium]|nr:DegT/DnrJ/EryC1/StrS family aminotransferase [Clostridiales bacterium]
EFEKEFAAWEGTDYALGFNNGTAALLAAMFAVGVGVGDEVICPSVTYWASALPAYSLGATIVFADIDPATLCIDPADIEKRVSDRTRAIMVIHYLGYPADMDGVMAVAKKHGLKVIEDVSHAHGGLYKGKKLGAIGDVSAFSLMSGKALVAGEAGMLATDSLECYERAIAFGHYNLFDESIRTESLRPHVGLPMGGIKGRMHQVSAAVGRVQLKRYDERLREIRKAMNYFWDLLEGVPGLRAHRVAETEGTKMGGWYSPHGHYVPEELGGLSVARFCEAVRAEGFSPETGCNTPLHTHSLFTTLDVYGAGKPTRVATASRDVRLLDRDLPVSLAVGSRTYSIPWFKRYEPELIRQYAEAYKKAARGYERLLDGDAGNPKSLGRWHFFNAGKAPKI